jgi:predicted double-glycine peptidase
MMSRTPIIAYHKKKASPSFPVLIDVQKMLVQLTDYAYGEDDTISAKQCVINDFFQ